MSRFRGWRVLSLSAVLLAAAAPIVGAEALPGKSAVERKSLPAGRLAGPAPVIDGRLDDPAWQPAAVGTDFIQRAPNLGRPCSQRTEARLLYDDEAIYVGMRLFDTAPDSIVSQLGRRDFSGQSDWAHVILDSYHDRRTAFRFSVNPQGVMKDVLHSDDVNEDLSWDAVWEAHTRVDSLGWTAEFRIPLSQLRFNSPADRTVERAWGVQFLRQIARRNERSWWSPMPADAPGMVSLFGDLTGLVGLKSPRHIELLPYSIGKLGRAPGRADDPFREASAWSGAAGGDLKYGLTSDLTLNATLNPDFGQVEADPSQFNLTDSETFFAEKRPFFLEGSDIFTTQATFPYGVRGGRSGSDRLFYTRRIGRSPQAGPPESAVFAESPDVTSILGAAKLSGKTAGGWTVGLLDALTAPERLRYRTDEDVDGRVLVEPRTNYLVARGSRNFRRGQDAVGLIVTGAHRWLDEANVDFLREDAVAAGMDARHRFRNGNYQLSAALQASRVKGSPMSIALTQSGRGHYYQRPDANHIDFDPTRTTLSGALANLSLEKIGGGYWRGGVYGHTISPGFETNDVGFLRNTDWILEGNWIGYNHFDETKHLNRWDLNLNQWSGWTYGGERRTTGINFNGATEFKNFWTTNLSWDQEFPALNPTELRGGPALWQPSNTNLNLNVATDTRPLVGGGLNVNYYAEPQSSTRSWDLAADLNLRPSSRVQITLSPGAGWNRNGAQYVGTLSSLGEPPPGPGGPAPHYVLARLEQTTAYLTARVNYTFTRDLTLQFYGQPFLTAGTYDAFREVANPRAHDLDARLRPLTTGETQAVGHQDFNFHEFRSNTVLRWEYRPGSALFLVWSQGRTGFTGDGRFQLDGDVKDLFRVQPANVFLVKVSYWLDV